MKALLIILPKSSLIESRQCNGAQKKKKYSINMQPRKVKIKMNKNLLGNFSQKKFGGPGEVSPVPPPSQWACLHLFTRVFGTNMHVLISNALFPTYVTSILKTFQSLVDGGRQATAPQWHRELMTEWPDKVVTFFLHASSRGSLDTVKYFIDGGLEPNLRYICKTRET